MQSRAVLTSNPRFLAGVLNHPAFLPVVIFGLSLVLRLIDIGRRPFWLDEIFTWQRVNLAPAALVHDSFANHHMPSYFLMLSPLTVLGDPQFWLRVPSALFGAISVALVFVIAKHVAGRMAGLLAALVLGLSPTALAFSQEARSYTLEMALILVALYGVVRLAGDVSAASLPWRGQGAPRAAWFAFIGGTAAALDVLGDGVPWLVVANIIFLVLMARCGKKYSLAKNLLLADGIITLLTAPFYILLAMYQDKKFIDSVTWIPPLDMPRLWYDVSSVYLMRIADSVTFRLMDVSTAPWVLLLIEGGLAVAAVAGAWRLRHHFGFFTVLGLSFIGLPAFLLGLSVWRSMLLPRYILWSSAPFAVLAGVGLSVLLCWLPVRGRKFAFGALAALFLYNLLPYYTAETKPRWDIAAKILARDVAPGDVVFLSDPWDDAVLRAYLPAGARQVVLQDSSTDMQLAEQAVMQGKRVWVVIGHAGQTSNTSHQMPDNFAKIAPLGAPSKIVLAGSRIYINLFDPTAPGAGSGCGPISGFNPGGASDLVLPPEPCS